MRTNHFELGLMTVLIAVIGIVGYFGQRDTNEKLDNINVAISEMKTESLPRTEAPPRTRVPMSRLSKVSFQDYESDLDDLGESVSESTNFGGNEVTRAEFDALSARVDALASKSVATGSTSYSASPSVSYSASPQISYASSAPLSSGYGSTGSISVASAPAVSYASSAPAMYASTPTVSYASSAPVYSAPAVSVSEPVYAAASPVVYSSAASVPVASSGYGSTGSAQRTRLTRSTPYRTSAAAPQRQRPVRSLLSRSASPRVLCVDANGNQVPCN